MEIKLSPFRYLKTNIYNILLEVGLQLVRRGVISAICYNFQILYHLHLASLRGFLGKKYQNPICTFFHKNCKENVCNCNWATGWLRWTRTRVKGGIRRDPLFSYIWLKCNLQKSVPFKHLKYILTCWSYFYFTIFDISFI